MNRRAALFVFSLVVSLSFAPSVFAHHQQEVLGDATESATPSLSATTEGPGLIMPDSPFFFLDTFKQNIRLFLAFTPEKKAELYAEIAGERLAELRFMIAKDDEEGAEVALEGVADNLEKSADQLADAKLNGNDVTGLAQDLNETIKRKRMLLEELEDTSGGELKERVKVVRKSLLESKVQVEDALPPDQLQQEIDEDIMGEVEDEAEEASGSARGLQHAIDILERNASAAAAKNQTQREAALRHAIEVKNDALRKQQEKGMNDDQVQIEANKRDIQSAKEAVRKAQEAAEFFRSAKKSTDGLKKNTPSKENSGPGSSNSEDGPGSDDL